MSSVLVTWPSGLRRQNQAIYYLVRKGVSSNLTVIMRRSFLPCFCLEPSNSLDIRTAWPKMFQKFFHPQTARIPVYQHISGSSYVTRYIMVSGQFYIVAELKAGGYFGLTGSLCISPGSLIMNHRDGITNAEPQPRSNRFRRVLFEFTLHLFHSPFACSWKHVNMLFIT